MKKALRAFEKYMTIERDLSENTVRTYLSDLKQFDDYLNENSLTLDEMNLSEIRKYLGLAYAEIEPSSAARRLSSLKSFFQFLLREGRIGFNPVKLIQSPKQKSTLPKFATVEQANRLMLAPLVSAWRTFRDLAILETLYSTGIRVSECENLLLDNIDFEGGLITVIQGKGRRDRIVPIGSKAIIAIKAYLKVRPFKSKSVFLNSRGEPLTDRQIHRIVTEYSVMIGRPDLTPHSLRHSCATHMIEGGANLIEVKEMLGHVSVSSTARYVHIGVDTLMKEYLKAHPRANLPAKRRSFEVSGAVLPDEKPSPRIMAELRHEQARYARENH
ncbi:tyrosine-type recombinase/integrase [Candidatus Manganitrophus noduliformans]|uniref:Tyrosine recombinase XerC n=1 Tax=Candidatus Manganitrophus noduliformans TaxID=2606439 RepID=A0A7X6DPZ0_9BACT|nr:tyrosine-type recombinase/integrase [Candidatus Manganitrophus noduliformans]NKE71248.1 tyrosine-type recombinase/integrase [Candidatus Manganitrophus noduliformans]